MPERKGDYFANKAEAIAYYKEHEENLKDKPEWMIDALIDFAIQYPNYNEYCEVESRVKNGQDLTAKQKKKYGHLKWEKEMTEYKEGQVLDDHVTIQKEGDYPDIINDRGEFEKINKYGLTYNEQQKTKQNLKDPVHIRFKDVDGEVVTAAPTEQGLMVDGTDTPMLEFANESLAKEHKRVTGEDLKFA